MKAVEPPIEDELKTVFRNGEVTEPLSFADVRRNVGTW
jgi:hypothetical protein